MYEQNGHAYPNYPPQPQQQQQQQQQQPQMNSPMPNGANFSGNGNNSPMPESAIRRPPMPPGGLGGPEEPPAENSNRHKLMNNRLKTLIQNRQNQKEMGQGGPMPPQYSNMSPTSSPGPTHHQSYSSMSFPVPFLEPST